jgi:hypothetical protein
MLPTRMHQLHITQARPDDARWLETTLARCGKSLATSVVLEGARLKLTW